MFLNTVQPSIGWHQNRIVDRAAVYRWQLRSYFACMALKPYFPRLNNVCRQKKIQVCRCMVEVLNFILIDQKYSFDFLPKLDAFAEKYWAITARLNSDPRYRDAILRTHQERELENQIKSHSRIGFHTSFWFGLRNVDFFFPMIAGYVGKKGHRHQGLIIELDGDIHNRYSKERRDLSCEQYAYDFNIAFKRYDNAAVYDGSTLALAKNLSSLKPLDTRGRDRVMMRAFLFTMLCHMSNCELSKFFNLDFDGMESIVKKHWRVNGK